MAKTLNGQDRRQRRTQQAIFDAFSNLFSRENYADITVQQIIQKANIGRSTFYDHYDSKEGLLDDLCAEMFHHVSSGSGSTLHDHGFRQNPGDLASTLLHLLFHLREDNIRLRGLLTGASSGLFLRKIEPYLNALVQSILAPKMECDGPEAVPQEFIIHYVVGAFNTTVKWWVSHNFREPPTLVASYLTAMLPESIVNLTSTHPPNNVHDPVCIVELGNMDQCVRNLSGTNRM